MYVLKFIGGFYISHHSTASQKKLTSIIIKHNFKNKHDFSDCRN